MTRRNRAATAGIVSALMVLWWQPSPRGQQSRALVSSAVRAAASQGQPVRVIVGVRVDGYQPEGGLGAPAAARQRADVQAVSQRVLGRLPSAARARTRAFDFIPYFSATIDANTLLQLEADPDVVSIEEDRLNVPTLAQSVPLIGGTNAWAAGRTGAGWTVAIVDTGVEKAHSFLAGKTVSEGCYSNANGAGAGASVCPGGVGSTTAPGSGLNCTVSTSCDHGTHVAGIAAGKGASFSGVAKDASIMAFQVFTDFGGGSLSAYNSDILAALNRVYALRGSFNIASVNLSLGGGAFADQASCDAANSAIKTAIDNLRSVNIATVIASGNNGYTNMVSSPGCISTAVSVGSTTKSDVVSSFSNAASFLNLLAPGQSINSSIPGNSFAMFSGTSMATPHVAGTWAVLKQAKPSGTVTEILNALRTTGLGITDTRNGLVFPRIRVDAALGVLVGPLLTIDSPAADSTTSMPLGIWGWAIDRAASSGTGISQVHLWAVPSGGGSGIFLGAASYGSARSDIGSLYGSQFTNSGYSLLISGLAPGPYTITAYGLSTVTGTFNVSKSVNVTVTGPASYPLIALDRPAGSSTNGRTVVVSGWAVDSGAPTGTGVDMVHVWASPTAGGPGTFLGAATYGLSRPDVGAGFGDSRFTPSGYQLTATLAPGNYMITAYMHSTVTNSFNAQRSATNVTVLASYPQGNIDYPGAGVTAARPFWMWGWAVDTSATSGTGVDTVHVWAFPVGGGAPTFVGAATTGQSRTDMGAYLGGSQFNNCGWSILVNSTKLPAAGTYDLYAYGRSTVTGAFSVIKTVRVTVS